MGRPVSEHHPAVGREEYRVDRPAVADLASAPDPELVLPLHNGSFAGIETDAAAFVEACGSLGDTSRLDEEDDRHRRDDEQ